MESLVLFMSAALRRYLLLEILTVTLSILVVSHFGFTWAGGGALIFTFALILLTIIDIEYHLLPDDITLPILWLGLLLNTQNMFTDLSSAIIGASAGYLILWCTYWLFKGITGKEGIGYGDFKLLAMLGAYLGWQALPEILFLSSASGAVIGLILIAFQYLKLSQPLPFGPFLALAGWTSLMWSDKIRLFYLSLLP